ncbi:general substrate transporter [Lophiotrema nucula]|uniref:General substrate transporter n=1 Tax=Lophiotrema nucula TaxID=690887 RepID=A0A6A5Z4C6_9PLEO|nr:general substrate transporter [Lophiotrema nucula]
MSVVPTFLGLNGKPLGIAITVILTFGFVLVGYDQGVMSGVITQPLWLENFPAVKGNATLLGFVVAVYDIGCLLGALTCMCFGDKLGRKKCCLLGGVSVIIGVVIQLASIRGSDANGALAQFIIGRVVTGLGNGVNMASMPVLQAELSHSARGSLVCLECGLIATGTMLSYWLNYGVRNYDSSMTWRFPIGFQMILALVYIAGTVFLPESPRWLCKVDKVEEATKVLAAVNGETLDAERTQNDLRAIVDSIALENKIGEAFRIKDLFTGGPSQHWRRVAIGVSSQFFQQIGGCNAVIYYFPILFQDSLGESQEQSLLLGGVNMIVYAVFSLVSFWTIERFGRRKLFLTGSAGQCLSMVITFACLIPGTPTAAKGAALGLFLYIAFFGATYLTVPWLYAAEINPLRIRQKGAALANIVNWSINFLVVMVTPIMVANIGWGTYIFFGAVNFLFIPAIYFFYPETSHRSLEEIDLIFAKGYIEKMSYVKAGKELPRLSVEDMEQLAVQYGLAEHDIRKRGPSSSASDLEKHISEHIEQK